MASGQVSFQNKDVAQQWIVQAQQLNAECNQLVNEVGMLLQALSDDGEGDLVTTVCNFGSQILQYANGIMDGVNQICSGFNQVFNIVEDIATGTIGKIAKGIGSLLGF